MAQEDKAKLIIEKVSQYLINAASADNTEELYEQVVSEVIDVLNEVE